MGVEYLVTGLAAWPIPMLNARAIAKQILPILIIYFSFLFWVLIAGGLMLTATQEKFSLDWVVSHLLLRRRLGEVLEKIKNRRAPNASGADRGREA